MIISFGMQAITTNLQINFNKINLEEYTNLKKKEKKYSKLKTKYQKLEKTLNEYEKTHKVVNENSSTTREKPPGIRFKVWSSIISHYKTCE